MKTWSRLSPLLALALSACDQPSPEISRAAESMRTATEQMATASAAKSAAREAKIVAAAIEIEEQRQAADPDAAGLPSRYEVRREGANWAVYDTLTGRYARHTGRTAAGLSRGAAEEAVFELQRDENEARFRAAIRQSVRDER